MFEDDPNSQGGPGQQKVTSVVGMVTGSTNWSRRSLRDQNPKKMYEEVGTSTCKFSLLPSLHFLWHLLCECASSKCASFVTQSMMSRRVKQYLSNLTIIQDEEKLRDMSQNCEPPQGSGTSVLSLATPLPLSHE